jgi:2-dehydro-3-deoxygluconokinase
VNPGDQATGTPAPRLAVIGETMINIGESGIQTRPAGDSAQLAIAAAGTGESVQVCLATALGDDPLSDSAVRALGDAGVQTTFIQRLPGELPAIAVDSGASTGPMTWRSGTAIRRMFPVHRGYLRELTTCDSIALTATSIALLTDAGRKTLLQLIRDFRNKGKRVALLLGPCPTLWSESESIRELDRCLSACSIVFAHRRDLDTVFGALAGDAAIDALHSRGITEVVTWNSPGQVLISNGQHRTAFISLHPINRTVLAGRYLGHQLAGHEAETALEYALADE